MFMQAVAFAYYGSGDDQEYILLANLNAPPGTYFLPAQPKTGANPFPTNIDASSNVTTTQTVNGLPSFSASIYGINNDEQTEFLVDWTNSNTVVWDVNCLQGSGNGLAPNASCAAAPTYLSTQFNADNSAGVSLLVNNFTN
jgi:hypothetical protein